MCPPDFYGIEYEINPWMDRRRPADREAALRQWMALRGVIEVAGASVSLLPPVEGLPDMVFTANAAMIFHDRAVLSNFRHAERQGEGPHASAWLAGNGFSVESAPAGISFEGAGDALFCGETLFAGYRIRSDASGHQLIADSIGVRVIPLELVDPYYYHLDTCFCPLNSESAIWFPAAFDDYGQRVISGLINDLIEVEEDEARRFACNAVVIGRTVITNNGCERLHAQLQQQGFEAVATPLDEFVKAGGSAKCLTLRLDGEEAASWKDDDVD
jgi:N-dimethylarginine dimethylaminohydrolase